MNCEFSIADSQRHIAASSPGKSFSRSCCRHVAHARRLKLCLHSDPMTGGRVYSYDNVDVFSPNPGADGRARRLFVTRRINDAQAAIVRRIFTLCADGFSLTQVLPVHHVAEALQVEQASGPDDFP